MSRLLVVDNYDSFTFNLVQYLGELGASLAVWRNDSFEPADVEALAPDGIVISPGPCTPAEAGRSVEVVQRFGPTVPTLGVCLGHQSIAAAYGARVVPATKIMHGKTSPVRHDGSGLFQGLEPEVIATRYHSLVVEDLPDALAANAWTDDDDGVPVIMGVRHLEHPVWGVQFHPESILTDDGHRMLATFLRAC